MSFDLWPELKNEIQHRITKIQFNQWIAPITASFEEPCLKLFFPNKMIKNYVEKTLLSVITDALVQYNPNYTVSLEIKGVAPISNSMPRTTTPLISRKEDEAKVASSPLVASRLNQVSSADNSKKSKATTTKPVTKKIKLANYIISYDSANMPENELVDLIKFRQSKKFSNFITGSSNNTAYSIVQSAATNLDNAVSMYSPIFLVGASGLGKTHLLYALGNEICKKYPDKKVVYVLSTDFRDAFVKLLKDPSKNKRVTELQEFYSSADVLLIDDIQLISNSTETLNSLFTIFNKITNRRRLIAVTSDVTPHELKEINDRFKTRFSGGANAFLEPPELEQRKAIALIKAKELKIKFKDADRDKVADYIAKNCRSNVREIEGALKSVYAQMYHDQIEQSEKISFDYVQNTLNKTFNSQNKNITSEGVIKAVCEYFHVTEKDLRSKKRYRTVSHPRAMAMYLLRELTQKSFPEIGKILDKDHSSVHNAHKNIDAKLKDNKDVQEEFNNLLKMI